MRVRALLDSGSELTLVSSEVPRRLRAVMQDAEVNVIGVGGNVIQRSTRATQLQLYLPDRRTPVTFTATCVRRLGIVTPAFPIEDEEITLRQNRTLADPQFGTPSSIELLVGADLLPEVLRAGNVQDCGLIAQNTAVGWTISGRSRARHLGKESWCLSSLTELPESPWQKQLAEMLQRFWEMEDVPSIQRQSAANEACERSFAEHRRTAEGKYVVRLPILDDGRNQLGDSETCARASLAGLHRRMSRDHRLATEYRQFMEEYVRLGHMERIPEEQLKCSDREVYYIPHHGIWQRGDTGDKLRVVFDASRPTTSGRSLNDVLHSGPKLQTDIWIVLLRWRTHRVAFCADIRMMFRQIWVDKRDVDLQRILWSPGLDQPPGHYRLLTVTYGTSCAPYLSLRVLQQLCTDEGKESPEIVEVALRDRYVDDILSGAHTVSEARQLRNRLVKLMEAGGMPLRKWVANHPELIEDINESERLRPTWINFMTEGPVRELGIAWNPREDLLGIGRPPSPVLQRSKRRILAALASIFDPCGWVAPATLTIKLLLQDLWRARLSWDEELPASMGRRWVSLSEEFTLFEKVAIPRWISTGPAPIATKIHAFADASRRALAAVTYSRTLVTEDDVQVNLLVAKTKLAPIRSLRPTTKSLPRMTIPRLELRAALIAARLLRRICEELKIRPESCFAWSDSQVVLHWIHSLEPTGNSIVDNYVHQIHELTPPQIWRYVPSEENPADIASRGATMSQLLQKKEWFSGPDWLKDNSSQWPPDRWGRCTTEPAAFALVTLTQPTDSSATTYLSAFSSLDRLLSLLVRLRRWARNRLNREPMTRVMDPLTPAELETAFFACIRLSQKQAFSEEITVLEQARQNGRADGLPRKGPLRGLNPFICQAGILRVGGRLEHSKLPFNQKHPPIISGAGDLARLIVSWAHTRALHGGFRSTYSFVLQRAWLIGGKRCIRRFIQNCTICARCRAAPLSQMMASLPPARVTPSRAFAQTGVDYAGPFQVLATKGRGVRTTKAYVAVFVCMASKAIHLELAGDLSTESLMGALIRFCGRRGRPAEIWSDNATNFHRADVELREALNQESLKWTDIQTKLAREGVTWKFIPPAAPHFGGLWEAAVRSFKTHLKRVIGPNHLTYEEFSTLLVSIEAVLNCRPLGPISNDIDDLHACTPGHLLVGDSLLTVPEGVVESDRVDQLRHWKLVQGLRAKFWRQWSREYLNTLQQRSKWTHLRDNVEVGNLVLVLDPSLLRPNGKWPLGRVTQVHPGRDGLVRTATVKTEHGVYTRPIVKMTVLPVAGDHSTDVTCTPGANSSTGVAKPATASASKDPV